MDTIGSRIKIMREQLKLSQQDIASMTGISRGNISNYEKGRVLPAADTIIALARFFKVSTDWLLTGEEKIPGVAPPSTPDNNQDIENTNPQSSYSIHLTKDEKEILQVYRNLSNEDKEFIRQVILLKYNQIQNGQKKKERSSISSPGEDVGNKEYA